MTFPVYPEIAPWAYALAFGVVFVAAIVQSTVGMGFGQVAAPLLLLIHTDFVPVPILIMGMAVAVLSSLRGWREVAVGDLGVALFGRMVGAVAAGLVLFYVASNAAFSLLFATLILLAIGLSLGKWKVSPSPKMLLLAGSASGFMGTITSVGAPPMGIVYQHSPGPKVRATLNAFFALGTVISLSALGWFGQLRLDHVMLAIVLTPALLAGTWISKYLTSFVDRRFRKLVLGISAASALAVIWKALI
ncbi:MAG: sulfite exporter TauE/SafE family protein [Rhodospirillales bacterium]|jgi:uncharacterized protein|nr:sulfite exporter TauE/SafE family protein [Rhodospirillales bacterium]